MTVSQNVQSTNNLLIEPWLRTSFFPFFQPTLPFLVRCDALMTVRTGRGTPLYFDDGEVSTGDN